MSRSGFAGKEYQNLVREGISAVRGGRLKTAHRLLSRAAAEHPTDARVWLWLSATTKDPLEQREMLERAVAADPGNTAAQRGLAILAEKLGSPVTGLPQQAEQVEMNAPHEMVAPAEASPATTFTFECPKCGGRMFHDDQVQALVCEFCGHGRETASEQVADAAETPLHPVLRTEQAHTWSVGLHEIECEQCGAHSYEQRGVRSQQCPYCGSHQLVESQQLNELVDPHAIALFRIKERKALAVARAWLKTGLFAPDDLQQVARHLALRPAYYPFWTFDGGVELKWYAEVRENYTRSTVQSPEWRRVQGAFVEFFDDVLVSGVSALGDKQLAGISPFRLKEVIGFAPEHLAGRPTMAYDRSLADASVRARGMVLKRLRRQVRSRIEPGRDKRGVRISAGHWSGVTYKLVLLPIWTGTYRYQEEEFRVLVNGQTGKVGGEKPEDGFKVAGIWVIGLLGVFLMLAAFVWLLVMLGN